MARRSRNSAGSSPAGSSPAGRGGASLAEAKRRVGASMLGRDGVHGVGVRVAEDAVVVYVAGSDAAQRAALKERAAPLAAPHAVVVVESEEATRA